MAKKTSLPKQEGKIRQIPGTGTNGPMPKPKKQKATSLCLAKADKNLHSIYLRLVCADSWSVIFSTRIPRNNFKYYGRNSRAFPITCNVCMGHKQAYV